MQTKVFTDFSGGCLNLVEIDSMKHIFYIRIYLVHTILKALIETITNNDR